MPTNEKQKTNPFIYLKELKKELILSTLLCILSLIAAYFYGKYASIDTLRFTVKNTIKNLHFNEGTDLKVLITFIYSGIALMCIRIVAFSTYGLSTISFIYHDFFRWPAYLIYCIKTTNLHLVKEHLPTIPYYKIYLFGIIVPDFFKIIATIICNAIAFHLARKWAYVVFKPIFAPYDTLSKDSGLVQLLKGFKSGFYEFKPEFKKVTIVFLYIIVPLILISGLVQTFVSPALFHKYIEIPYHLPLTKY